VKVFTVKPKTFSVDFILLRNKRPKMLKTFYGKRFTSIQTEPKCINLILYMLIWAMFDCRHKLDQIGVKYHKLEGAKEKKRCVN
jgi:hypothetical protein